MKTITILCVGDIVGQAGLDVLTRQLPRIQEEHHVDVTVVNVENTANGYGLTYDQYCTLDALNIDVMTSGNHVFDQPDVRERFDMFPKLIRPLNFSTSHPGPGSLLVTVGDSQVGVVNGIGHIFMSTPADPPFDLLQNEVQRLRDHTPIIVVDFHGETTFEKNVLARLLDGHASLVFGTHTHTQTADERIFPGGTAFISDVGMTGAYDSILGMDIQGSIRNLTTNTRTRVIPPDQSSQQIVCAVKVSVDCATGQAVSIDRIQVKDPS